MGKNKMEEKRENKDQQFVADDQSLLLDASRGEDDSWCGGSFKRMSHTFTLPTLSQEKGPT